MSRDSEFAWQPWIAALGGLASSAALLATVPFSRFDDVLLFLAWGAALAEGRPLEAKVGECHVCGEDRLLLY